MFLKMTRFQGLSVRRFAETKFCFGTISNSTRKNLYKFENNSNQKQKKENKINLIRLDKWKYNVQTKKRNIPTKSLKMHRQDTDK